MTEAHYPPQHFGHCCGHVVTNQSKSLLPSLYEREELPLFDRNVPRKPRLVGGVKGHNMNETSFPGSPALWAGSFTFGILFRLFLFEFLDFLLQPFFLIRLRIQF